MGRPPGKKLSRYLTIRLDDEMWETLDGFAKAEERTTSQMARMILREGLRARGGKQEKGTGASRSKRRGS